jgi:hypothetical protein
MYHGVYFVVDDVVLIDESRTGINRKLESLWETLEFNGFRLNRNKSEYMICDLDTTTHEEDVSLDGQVAPKKDNFW